MCLDRVRTGLYVSGPGLLLSSSRLSVTADAVASPAAHWATLNDFDEERFMDYVCPSSVHPYITVVTHSACEPSTRSTTAARWIFVIVVLWFHTPRAVFTADVQLLTQLTITATARVVSYAQQRRLDKHHLRQMDLLTSKTCAELHNSMR